MSDRQRTNGSKEGPEIRPADPTEDRQSASRYSVPALEKGLEILELLAQEPTGLSGTQIANRLSRSTGEIYRIIQYLEWRGYLERDRESDLYSLTMRMFRLSHEHPPLRSHLARQPLLRGLPLHASLLKRLFLAALGLGESVVAQLLRAHGLQPLLRQRGV